MQGEYVPESSVVFLANPTHNAYLPASAGSGSSASDLSSDGAAVNSVVTLADRPGLLCTVKWRGFLPGSAVPSVGVVASEPQPDGTDGRYSFVTNGRAATETFFSCAPGHGLFVPAASVRRAPADPASVRSLAPASAAPLGAAALAGRRVELAAPPRPATLATAGGAPGVPSPRSSKRSFAEGTRVIVHPRFELGTVRFAGTLPDRPQSERWLLVELDWPAVTTPGSPLPPNFCDGIYTWEQALPDGRRTLRAEPLVRAGSIPSRRGVLVLDADVRLAPEAAAPFPLGTVVKVRLAEGVRRRGCVRYVGPLPDRPSQVTYYGVELFEPPERLSVSRLLPSTFRRDLQDGSYRFGDSILRFFECEPGLAVFVGAEDLEVAPEFLAPGPPSPRSTSQRPERGDGERAVGLSQAKDAQAKDAQAKDAQAKDAPRQPSPPPSQRPGQQPPPPPAVTTVTLSALQVQRQLWTEVMAGPDGGWAPEASPALGSNVLFSLPSAALEQPRRLMRGVCEWVGSISGLTGRYAGLRLHAPEGDTDGAVQTGDLELSRIRYFQCQPNHGLFVPLAAVWDPPADLPGAFPGGRSEGAPPAVEAAPGGFGRSVRHAASYLGLSPTSGRPGRDLPSAPSFASTAPPRRAEDPWKCLQCTFLNEGENARSRFCAMCDGERTSKPAKVDAALARTADPLFGPMPPGVSGPTKLAFPDPPVAWRMGMGGLWRGIQGQNNSCSVDAVLFALFAGCDLLDRHLLRDDDGSAPHPGSKGLFAAQQYPALRRHLRNEIVTPLRFRFFVDYAPIVAFRTMLHSSGLIESPTMEHEEKDAEEVFAAFFRVLGASETLFSLTSRGGWDPTLSAGGFINSGFIYNIVGLGPSGRSPGGGGHAHARSPGTLVTSQRLLEDSLEEHGLEFRDVPPLFLVQLPRSGEGKAYSHVLPSAFLDLTKMLPSSYALHRQRHDHCTLELFAAVAIGSSHYVAFALVGGEWVFHDSMAERLGEAENIPRVTPCGPEFARYLRKGVAMPRLELAANPLLDRLCSDAYILCYRKIPE